MSRIDSTTRHLLSATGCELRDDLLHRRLYATDASIYEIEPAAVAFPKSAVECSAVLRIADDRQLAVSPRGAGTGLAGGALGGGLILDMARHSRWIEGLDCERLRVRVGAGVVLDQLNAFLRPHGLVFGPDVATASRATLGGMIANNSSGAHSPVYGTTADHVRALEVVLADGRIAVVGADHDDLERMRRQAEESIRCVEPEIRRRLSADIGKRWPGYGLDRFLDTPEDLTQLLAGSEGTLAIICAAELQLSVLPASRSLGVLFFETVQEAMAATRELSDLEVAAVEHLDAKVFEQTRNQLAFARARELLELDARPCGSMLLVEFFDDEGAQIRALENKRLGQRMLSCRDPEEQELVWSMRRAGLSLLTSCAGPAKPAACIEDVCVRSEDLPAYVDSLVSIMDELGLEASYYGHAAAGELHVRPVVDLHTECGVGQLRAVTDAVATLTLEFRGSLAGEHGVGIARTEYVDQQLGPELSETTRRIKSIFDPRNRLNPGKIIDTGRYHVDGDLRFGAGYQITVPYQELLGFRPRDLSLVNNLEQCNGCGGCRKDVPTMCPTFIATGEEVESTRGRANVIRSALDGHFGAPVMTAEELATALDDCLSCKACAKECPSGVDLAKLKAEILQARHELRGPSLLDRMIANADLLGRLGCVWPGLSNRMLEMRWIRWLMEAVLGLSKARSLPHYTDQRFDRWFDARAENGLSGQRTVLLWDDTWVRYHEPEVGRAAVTVLEAAGCRVVRAETRQCCGRPSFSRGLLAEARKAAVHNIALLNDRYPEIPIVFLEPSCYSMLIDEYPDFGIDGAEELAARCFLFEDFVLDILGCDPKALRFKKPAPAVSIHHHCHAKALTDTVSIRRLATLSGAAAVHDLDTGCCGMAGAFGMLAAKQELSKAVAQPLVEAISEIRGRCEVVAAGTSCRHQIRDLTDVAPLHPAEMIARCLDE